MRDKTKRMEVCVEELTNFITLDNFVSIELLCLKRQFNYLSRNKRTVYTSLLIIL